LGSRLSATLTLTAFVAAATASKYEATAIIRALQSTGANPEALATRLVQQTSSSTAAADPASADKTGYEHCADCAMPAIQNLKKKFQSSKNLHED
jgi:hypothetical protein